MWVCGLKLFSVVTTGSRYQVAPYVGVWIETLAGLQRVGLINVAPYVGVWIETRIALLSIQLHTSHPMWVCGLKPSASEQPVSPYRGRTLCGCVD